MLSRITARMVESWQPKAQALDRAQAHLKQAEACQEKKEWDSALNNLIKAKAALKTLLQSDGHLLEAKRLLADVHLTRAHIIQLGKDGTTEEVRINYLKAQAYSPDTAKQEVIKACLDRLACTPRQAKIQRKATLPPSSVPPAPVLPTGLPAEFFASTPPPSLLSQPYRLVGPDDIENTEHLAWCLQQTSGDAAQHKQLYLLAREVVERFGKRKGKDLLCMREAAELAAIPYAEIYSALIAHAVHALNPTQHAPLNSAVVQGLAMIVRHCPARLLKKEDGVRADTWTSILSVLLVRLKAVHKGNPAPVQELVEAIAQLLDAMVQAGVAGISREQLQKPLQDVLREEDVLNPHQDVDLAWHIRYAQEALAYVPNDESTGEAVLRCLFSAGKGVLSLASAIKNCDVDKLLESFDRFEDTFAGARELANTVGATGGLKAAIKDAQEMAVSFGELKTSYEDRPSQKGWYTALQCLDLLIDTKAWSKFEQFIRHSAYRHHVDFLQGVCQRLERIVCVEEDLVIQEQAIQFLKSLAQNSAHWMDSQAGGLARSHSEIDCVKQKAQTTLIRLENRAAQRTSSSITLSFDWYAIGKEGISTELLQAARRTLAKPLVKKLFNTLAHQIEKLRADYVDGLEQDREIKDALANYVAPEGMALHDDTRFDLENKIHDFLESEKECLLLSGDAGIGKSTFNRYVARSLWQKYMQATKPEEQAIPIFIALSSLPSTSPNLVSTFFKQHGFTEEQIHTLQTQYHFVLILDGFDEIEHRHRPFYQDNALGKFKNAKIIISSRSEYLGAGYQYKFHPPGEPMALQEYRMAFFSKETIACYVDRYSATHPHALWSAQDYIAAFEEPSVQALVSNPFLLKLAVSALPTLNQAERKDTRFTRLSLYAQFVASWFARSQQRLSQIRLDTKETEEFKRLEEEGFYSQQMLFSQALAMQMYQAGEVVSSYTSPASKSKRARDMAGEDWRENLLSNTDLGTKLKRLNAPLICQDTANGLGKTYRFIHKSLRDYFVAWALWEEFNESSELEQEAWFNTIYIARDPAILNFLSERVQQEATFKVQLLQVIECTKTNAELARAAANAITVLVRAGVQFNGADLRGIKVPGADLSGGVFDSAQLQGADLSKTHLRHIWLRQANVSDAQMDGVQFGEWPYLQEESGVRSCAYSPDGKTYAAGLYDGKISVYAISNWEKIYTLEGHKDWVRGVVYSPSSGQLASGSGDKTVRLWNAKTGQLSHILEGHTGIVLSVVYSPSGGQLASGSADHTVRLWDAQTGAPGLILEGHNGTVMSVAYSPSGEQVASGSWDRTVRLWDAQSGAPGLTIEGHTDKVLSVVYSPNGEQLASGSWDRTVRLWDVQSGAPSLILEGHAASVVSVVYSPSGEQLVSGSGDKTVRLWDAQTGAPGLILEGHTDGVWSVMYSPNGEQLASGSVDKTVRLWNAQSGALSFPVKGHTDGVWSVVYSPSGEQLASGSLDKTVRLWDAQSGTPGCTLEGHTAAVYNVVYSPTGEQLASSSGDKTVRLWEAQSGTPGFTLEGHTAAVYSVVYSAGGEQLASGSWDKTVRLWDVQTGALALTLEGHTAGVYSVAYSPNGEQLASGSMDKTVRLWDVRSGAPGLTLEGHTAAVYSVVYSPNGEQLASGSDDKTVRLWNAKTGQLSHILEGHTGTVMSVVYSPSGEQLASGSGDKTVRLWNPQTGQCQMIIQNCGPVIGLAWKEASDGCYLGVSSADKSVRQWKVKKEGEAYKMELCWSTTHSFLTVRGTSIEGVRGVSPVNYKLLKQRGAATASSEGVSDVISVNSEGFSELISQAANWAREKVATFEGAQAQSPSTVRILGGDSPKR